MKKALITGITGQDGSYLAELLLEKGYEVYGFVQGGELLFPDEYLNNIKHINDKLNLIPIIPSKFQEIGKEIVKIKPDEIYHLASITDTSFLFMAHLLNVNVNYIFWILETINLIKINCKIFFAGSSEMFGDPVESPQTENTMPNPRNPYGISKLASYYLCKQYREQHKVHVSTGIMYNHTSIRQSNSFVVKKIVEEAVKIKRGKTEYLELGNWNTYRDFGYAKDYVKAMWLMLQQEKPDDYIISTMSKTKIIDIVKHVFTYLKLDYQTYLKINNNLYRPSEGNVLCGNNSKLVNTIGWNPSKQLPEILNEMIDYELVHSNNGTIQ